MNLRKMLQAIPITGNRQRISFLLNMDEQSFAGRRKNPGKPGQAASGTYDGNSDASLEFLGKVRLSPF